PVVVEDLPAAESTEAVDVAGAVISGQVSDQLGRQIEVQLMLTAPTGEVVSLTAGEQGEFLFEALAPGEYVLEASAPGFLSRQHLFTLIDGEQLELPLTTLRAGDLNQDNRVDLNDIVLITANYNGPAMMAEADLNGDGWIDIRDLTIVGAQVGVEGPLPGTG